MLTLSVSTKIENHAESWRIDDHGFLRCTARVLKSGTFGYSPEDVPKELRQNFAGKTKVMERVPSEEFTDEALASLEGKPVIAWDGGKGEPHEWRDPKNAAKDGRTVGSVAGKPRVDESGIICDLLITDAETIADVKAGKVKEVSAAYNSELSPAGADDGQGMNRADAVQRALRFNHVLLLPEGKGRCGSDVRILNSKGSETMVKVKIGNSGEFEFSTQADADRATQLVQNAVAGVKSETDEEKKKIEANCKNAVDAAHAEGSEHLNKFAELSKLVDALKAQILQLTSEEHQEGVAQERGAYKTDEGAVVNASPDSGKLRAAIGNCKSIAERRKAIVVHVMNARKQDTSKLTDDTVRACFDLLCFDAKNGPKRTFTLPEGKPQAQRTQNADGSAKVHPYYRK